MLLASNHMFPNAPIECVMERLAKAGAGGLDLFLPHVPYLLDARFGAENLKSCRAAAEAAGVPIQSIIQAPLAITLMRAIRSSASTRTCRSSYRNTV